MWPSSKPGMRRPPRASITSRAPAATSRPPIASIVPPATDTAEAPGRPNTVALTIASSGGIDRSYAALGGDAAATAYRGPRVRLRPSASDDRRSTDADRRCIPADGGSDDQPARPRRPHARYRRERRARVVDAVP